MSDKKETIELNVNYSPEFQDLLRNGVPKRCIWSLMNSGIKTKEQGIEDSKRENFHPSKGVGKKSCQILVEHGWYDPSVLSRYEPKGGPRCRKGNELILYKQKKMKAIIMRAKLRIKAWEKELHWLEKLKT